MTAYELKALHHKNFPDGHYFDRRTMRFFGDTMKNFGVYNVGMVKVLDSGEIREVDAVMLYRKRPVNGGMHGDTDLFNKETGQVIYSYTQK
jgi:hypothetical protein